MILGIYSVKDARTGFLQPTFELNDPVAMRNFKHASLDEKSLLKTFSQEYSLYKIGTFDTVTGEIVPSDPEVVADAF